MHARPARILLLAALAALLATAAAAGDPPDWNSFADVDTVSAVTTNEDGTQRYTTVWIVVVGGRAYLRTGGTTWGDNVVRDPNLVLQVGETQYPVRAEFVEAEDERGPVTEAFRLKYGAMDAVLGVFRGSKPKIMRLAGR
jgi:hypothetical protein